MSKKDFFEFLDLNNDFITEIELMIHRVSHFNDAFSQDTLLQFENFEDWIEEYNQNRPIE